MITNDAYILARGDISVIGYNAAIQVAIKNCARFVKCITKINGKTIDHAEVLDLIMPMYNLLEYSSDYSDMAGSLRFYLR